MFTPLYDKLLVEKDPEQTTIAGGIVLPESAKEKPESGRILATGHGRLLENGNTVPLQVQVGDHVLFHKYSGSEIKIEGKKYLIMDESDIFGILPRTPKEQSVE
jgi:chaperonin GroES